MSKKTFSIIIKIFLILLVLLLLIVGAFRGCAYYYHELPTVHYVGETENGHTVKVVQLGRNALLDVYTIVIEVDGGRVAKFKVRLDSDYRDEHLNEDLPQLYPKELISVTIDSDREYRLEFADTPKNYTIVFDANFEKILCVYAYDFECLVEDLPVIVDESMLYDPF